MKLSLCMIVRDEEAVLARCLDGVKQFVDEIVIVDTGSQDGTVGIARRYTDRIFFEPWRDDFAYARNVSFSKATGDYLLWLDADDVVTAENGERLLALKQMLEDSPCDMVMCPYETGSLRYERERVVRRSDDIKWRGHVHECIPPKGKLVHAEFTVLHRPTGRLHPSRNLEIYRKWAGEETLSGRDLFYYGRELFYHKLYVEGCAVLEEMLSGEGWYVNKIEACRTLAACRLALGRREEALCALLRSLCYGEPRAAVLCDIGHLFKEDGRYGEAAFWYESALRCRDHTADGDFEQPDCRGITPTLELVWLYHVLGDRARSLEMHKKSEALAPDHPSVIFNKKFFGE